MRCLFEMRTERKAEWMNGWTLGLDDCSGPKSNRAEASLFFQVAWVNSANFSCNSRNSSNNNNIPCRWANTSDIHYYY